MSSNTSHTLHSKQTVSGTNSPPLEATGEDKPMGQACVDDCTINAGHVSDEEQRKGYFPGSFEKAEEAKQPGKSQEKKMGQSMAAKMEERT